MGWHVGSKKEQEGQDRGWVALSPGLAWATLCDLGQDPSLTTLGFRHMMEELNWVMGEIFGIKIVYSKIIIQ